MASDGKKVAIVGSGLIGRCWAMLFARAGYNPVLFDIEPKQLDAASESILSQLKGLESGGLLRGQRAEDVFARVKTTSNLRDAVTGAVYLQECVPEVLDLKRKIFGQLDEIADDSIVLASSTSCITASSFTENLKHRDQCLVAHPINPPHYIPLVELVPAPWTRPAITQRARDILKSIGQSPVTLKKEVDGFVVNRLQYALLMEAWRLVEVRSLPLQRDPRHSISIPRCHVHCRDTSIASLFVARAGWRLLARGRGHSRERGAGAAVVIHGPIPDDRPQRARGGR
eukprot:Opistho-1_new@5554